jgi:hypothetical protein
MQLNYLGNANDHETHVLRAIVEQAGLGRLPGNMACGHDFHIPQASYLRWIPDTIPAYDPQLGRKK